MRSWRSVWLVTIVLDGAPHCNGWDITCLTKAGRFRGTHGGDQREDGRRRLRAEAEPANADFRCREDGPDGLAPAAQLLPDGRHRGDRCDAPRQPTLSQGTLSLLYLFRRWR